MVPTSTPGFSVTKYEDKSGFRTISTCSLKFDNVRVPAATWLVVRLAWARASASL